MLVCYYENSGHMQRVQNIQEYNPIVLLFYKLLSKKKTLPVKLNAVPPRIATEMFSKQS